MAVYLALVVAAWAFCSLGYDLLDKCKHSASFWTGVKKLKASYWGMQLAHLGVVVSLIGVVMVSYYSEEKLLRLAPGDHYSLEQYQFVFQGVKQVEGPNYTSLQGRFKVTDGNHHYFLYPEKRRYLASGQVMTEAAINAGLLADVYVSLGEDLGAGQWSVRIYIKTFVRWIWLGAIFMALGAFVSMTDKRYRLKVSKKLSRQSSHVEPANASSTQIPAAANPVSESL